MSPETASKAIGRIVDNGKQGNQQRRDREPPLVAFDNSALSRLTDTDGRLAAEIAAVEAVVVAIRAGYLRLLATQILFLEVTRTPTSFHAPLLAVLDLASASVLLEPTRPLAQRLASLGFRPADALHIAAAYTGGADYLLIL